MKLIKVAAGIFIIDVPDAGLNVLCGCPADSVKHLKKSGLIATTEKNGIRFETGPNAILLSDVSLQKGRFANLAEFPVLQMFYFQGMLIPGHPNNTGEKPILIGIEEQLKAQMEYIFRGNYGLASVEEIIAAGMPESAAAEMMRMKRRFAFDNIRKSEDLFRTVALDAATSEIKNGVFIRRTGVNLYEFSYHGQRLYLNLNLGEDEDYLPTYDLGFHKITREHFSIIHSGDGDGWDVNRPCMSGIIVHRGRIFLVDAGPNIIHSLRSLGIGIGEIEGIFHTHAHDDHFNGLTVIMRSDHRIKYYATSLVRASVVKKLCALMSFGEEHFERFFDVRDLAFDRWNDVDGLEVMPVFSPHPVETGIFFFRASLCGAYKTYAHLADIISLKVLEGMITEDAKKSGVTKKFYETVMEEYLTPANIKKIDIGGGMIHGDALDFRNDTSGKLILSHIARPLTGAESEIGTGAAFGDVDILIPADEPYLNGLAREILKKFFPELPRDELELLTFLPVVSFAPGEIIIQNGERVSRLYLLLTGVAEYSMKSSMPGNKITAGTFMGEYSVLMNEPSTGITRAYSNLSALDIPAPFYIEILKRNDLLLNALEDLEGRRILTGTWLFGERLSCAVRSRVAKKMTPVTFEPGQEITVSDPPGIFFITKGTAEVSAGGKMIDTADPGGFFGEETVLYGSKKMTAAAKTRVNAFLIPGEAINDIPIIQWKMIEVCERRMRSA